MAEPFICFGVVDVALEICDAGEQPLGDAVVHLTRGKVAEAFFQVASEGLIREVFARNADHAEDIRQKAAGPKIVECRNQQPAGEIARSAEDHEQAGIRGPNWRRCSVRAHRGSIPGSTGPQTIPRSISASSPTRHLCSVPSWS